MRSFVSGIFAAAAMLLAGGCSEGFREAFDPLGSSIVSGGPAYLISFNEVIRHPRGVNRLEQRMVTYTGQEIWYKSHPALSSNDIREAKAVPIKDRPELCSLQLRLNRQGRLKWQILYQLHKETPLIMLIDGVWVGDFVPGSLNEPDQEWVDVNCVVDSVTASGIVKHAPDNYQEANPDDKENQNSDSLF